MYTFDINCPSDVSKVTCVDPDGDKNSTLDTPSTICSVFTHVTRTGPFPFVTVVGYIRGQYAHSGKNKTKKYDLSQCTRFPTMW